MRAKTHGRHAHAAQSERGYALLIVFLLAALVALMLYQQMPRVAFEAERDKEQLLVDRGEQYCRAISLYFLANGRLPTSIEDLEQRDKRFLRRRYVDPYTGKDEWRLVHSNGQFLTDSLVQKPPDDKNGNGSTAANALNTNPNEQPQVNAAVLQRPSDRVLAPDPANGFVPANSGQANDAPPQNAPLPPISLQPIGGPQQQQANNSAFPPITMNQPGQQPNAGGLPPITLQPATGNQQPGVTPLFPGQPVPNQPQIAGRAGIGGTALPAGFRIDPNGQIVPVNQGAQPGQLPGAPGAPSVVPGLPGTQPVGGFQPGANPQQNLAGAGNQQPGNPTAAINLINQLLTTPRPAAQQQLQTISSSNTVGGIAGVASTHTGPSIMVYKDRQKYEEWEFIYQALQGAGAGGAGGQGGRGGQNGPGGAPITPNGVPFGPAGQQGPGRGGTGFSNGSFPQNGTPGPGGLFGSGPNGPGTPTPRR